MSPPFRLTARPLNAAEAEVLHCELKTTANILGYLPGELTRFSECFVATETETGSFAGACLCKDLLGNWTDIAVLYVLPAFRERGVSRLLFEAAFDDAHVRRGRHIYVLSRSPQIVHLMQAKNMAIAKSAWHAPLAVHFHTQIHLSHWYRWKEAIRKAPLRQKDRFSFVAGTLRFRKITV